MGYEIDEDAERYEWFKLGLSKTHLDTGLSRDYPSRTALPIPIGAECEKLVEDYLRGLRKHVEEYLPRRLVPRC